jgi:hypothetical protein
MCSLTMVPALAAGQTPVDWEMHISVLDAGDRIDVRTIEGQKIRGQMVRFDAQSITLQRQGRETRLPATTVFSVERHDSLWNGGLIGLAAGFSTGALMMATCEPGFLCEHSAEAILACGGLAGSFGFGVGVLFDAIVHGDHTVFRRSEPGRVELAPVVTRTEKSMAVRLRF